MTLDEAIKHCLEQARKLQDKADRVGDDESRQCMECAADHIQLADWLIELKDLRAEQHEQGVFIKELMKHSAADVQPVKRGRWLNNHAIWIEQHEIEGYFVQAECSECGRWAHKMNPYTHEFAYDFCPHCGADMRGEENEV